MDNLLKHGLKQVYKAKLKVWQLTASFLAQDVYHSGTKFLEQCRKSHFSPGNFLDQASLKNIKIL